MSFTDTDGADTVRACTRKKGYPSERIARQSIASIHATSPYAVVRAYACRRCGFWHVGGAARDVNAPVFSNEDAIARRDVGFENRRSGRDRVKRRERVRPQRLSSEYSRPRRRSPRPDVEDDDE